MLPKSTPKISREEVLKHIAHIDSKKYPVVIVGIRGYYLDTMGVKGKNDRGIYDDAIILITPNVYAAFNGNTDPSAYRTGIANLKEGTYYAHNFGLHKGQYLALVQRMGAVTVLRDGGKEDTGYFGINIHRGGVNTTSSEGCQTIPTSQYNSFISLAQSEAKRAFGTKWDKAVIPYVLV
jgi:hypothetical protein